MKTFVTNTSIYRIEKREDGELDMYREYSRKSRHSQWVKDGSKYADVGMFVKQRGAKIFFFRNVLIVTIWKALLRNKTKKTRNFQTHGRQ